jgi:nucleotide-binding universal stress UspA family protein
MRTSIQEVDRMSRNVTVGLDGSSESRAAAEWAAREAKSRGLPVRLVHVWEPVPEPMAQAPLLGAETQAHWSERIPREAAEGLPLRHPGVDVTVDHVNGRPGEVLTRVARDAVHKRTAEGSARKVLLEASHGADLLVVGARRRPGHFGLQLGLVAHTVLHHAACPVAVVPQRV